MEWTEQDKVGLRDYLSTGSGQSFMEMLGSSIRAVTATNFEEVALEAKYKQGQEDTISLIKREAQQEKRPTPQSDFIEVSKDVPR